MKRVSVSVITVCRNAAEELKKTISSVLIQEDVDMELVIVDGASTDHSVNIIRATEEQCRQIGISMHWVSEPDKGIYDAMNKGVKMASKEWLNFMNAGDQFASSNVLQRLLSNPQITDADVVYGSVNQVFDFGTVEMKPAPLVRLKKKMAFCHQACLLRSSLLAEHPYNLNFPLAADYELIHWCYTQGKHFVKVDFPIANFEAEEGASSKNRLQLNREFARISGRHTTWGWRFEYAGKVLEVGFNKITRFIMPQHSIDKVRKKNYQRIQQKRNEKK